MVIAIDMIGTNLGSGTKTYNLNFCENLHKLKIENTFLDASIQNQLQMLKSKLLLS